MKQLLRADFYRLLRSKFFYILLAVAFALSLISFLLYLAIARLAEEDLFALLLTAEDLQILSFDGTVGYCAAIAAAIFICGDYSGGGMRNKIVAGCGRRKIFYSKLIVCSVVSVAVYLAMQVVVFAFGGAAFGWQGVSGYDVACRFVAGLFMSLAYAAIFASFALLLQKLSSALVLGVVCIFAVTLVTSLLAVAEQSLDMAAFEWLYKIFAHLTPMGHNSLMQTGAGNFWALSAISVAWVVLAVVAVPICFKRCDIR